ncbi:thioredoxin-like domain-containing protein [Lentisphaerota bacterium WC36G]|nr:hypothetical protein LJT99_07310 [Lentisphaerae bacterium WC36]
MIKKIKKYAVLSVVMIASCFFMKQISAAEFYQGIGEHKMNVESVVHIGKNLQWFNVSRPLRKIDFNGRVVLLDFWTYCCINCIHVIPDLVYLENKYKDKLLVIGVHCGKFSSEKNSENIRQAILRYKLSHPVVNDENYRLWRIFNVHAWPTMVLLDQNGNFVNSYAGENNRKILDLAISSLLGYSDERMKKIAEMAGDNDNVNSSKLSPLPIALERNKVARKGLSYPAKVDADKKLDLVVVSDSNHNRIIVSDFAGNLKHVIGSGMPGARDGSFSEATFNMPKGVCIMSNKDIYVADTENNLLRKISLKEKRVVTVAGNMQRGNARTKGGKGLLVPLNSPWGLTKDADEKNIYIAMAGCHQIWRYEIATNRVELFAGSGVENIFDGGFIYSAFAQPSGITYLDGNLFVADSETSSIREIFLKRKRVQTIVGQGLFTFGNQDGTGRENVRLQHPLGIAAVYDKYDDGDDDNVESAKVLYIADTYNNLIKKVYPDQQKVDKLLISEVKFDEPGGLSYSSGYLFVADTNNSRIVKINLKEGKAEIFVIKDLPLPKNYNEAYSCPLPPNL